MFDDKVIQEMLDAFLDMAGEQTSTHHVNRRDPTSPFESARRWERFLIEGFRKEGSDAADAVEWANRLEEEYQTYLDLAGLLSDDEPEEPAPQCNCGAPDGSPHRVNCPMSVVIADAAEGATTEKIVTTQVRCKKCKHLFRHPGELSDNASLTCRCGGEAVPWGEG